MEDTTVKKVDSSHSPHGEMGQLYLASGKHISMRMWSDLAPGEKEGAPTKRQYETVGFVLKGRAKLKLGEQIIELKPGDSWLVPKGAEHHYEIIERFSAIEATSPPSQIHNRDEAGNSLEYNI